MPPFLASAQVLPTGTTLRGETTADRDFLADLYASTREEELRSVDWNDARKHAFLRSQFELQWAHYRQHYQGAEWLVVLREDVPIGRLYLKTGAAEVRLMDIALVPAQRRQGMGTVLMRAVLHYADQLGAPVSLHVEPFNPAFGLYGRLGFSTVETRGIYCFMQRPPQGGGSI